MLETNKLLKITKVALIIMTVVSILFAIMGVTSASNGVFRVPNPSGGDGVEKVYSISGVILGIVQAIGMSIAVIILVWLGVKYIMASPDGKAEIKKQAFGYILGAVLLFGASWLVPLLKNVIDGLSS